MRTTAVRFGIQQGLIDDMTMEQVNTALLISQPAHLQRLFGTELTPVERDQRRAGLMRQVLGRN